ncbi:MAG: hypothetical protein ACK4WF_04185 [Candidatus Brocadiales bacterium]
MGWGKKKAMDGQMDTMIRARNRKKTIALVSGIGLGVATVLLGMVTLWLLSMQAFLQDMTP